MKKRILILSMVVALLSMLVMPMAALADAETTVSGRIEAAIEITAPSGISLGPLAEDAGGIEANSATPGEVYSNVEAWTLGVGASLMNTNDATRAGLSLNGLGVTELTNGLGTGETIGTNDNTLAAYIAELEGLDGSTGTINFNLYVKQVVTAGDAAGFVGVYSVILTYTASG